VRAIFRIYAKTTAALARVVCHHTLMKISEYHNHAAVQKCLMQIVWFFYRPWPLPIERLR